MIWVSRLHQNKEKDIFMLVKYAQYEDISVKDIFIKNCPLVLSGKKDAGLNIS